MNNENPLLLQDSYKYSHFNQYPAGANAMFSYISPRSSKINGVDSVSVFGLQMAIHELVNRKITLEHVREAKALMTAHGLPFPEEAFKKIVEVHNGRMPLRICAVPEGTEVPIGNVIATVESTDPDLFWLGSWAETQILRAIWYPTTVATISKACKRIIYQFLQETSDDPDGQIGFKLHDFGARGVSSNESAGLGGVAHLTNFYGTDTVMALVYAARYYGENLAGFSIPAAEHSTITSWGKDNEVEAFRNMISQYGKAGAMFAVVSDSYNIFHATDVLWGEKLKQEVIDSGATLVVRPDSGDPISTVLKVVDSLSKSYGFTVNNKGYKVLNGVRVIQGDGVDLDSIKSILVALKLNQFSADNVAFGMGGGLLQKVDRDTFGFAMKCSAIRIGDTWQDVYKDPVGGGKTSHKGRLALVKGELRELYHGEYIKKKAFVTVTEERAVELGLQNQLEVVYLNGTGYNIQSFEDVRKRASKL